MALFFFDLDARQRPRTAVHAHVQNVVCPLARCPPEQSAFYPQTRVKRRRTTRVVPTKVSNSAARGRARRRANARHARSARLHAAHCGFARARTCMLVWMCAGALMRRALARAGSWLLQFAYRQRLTPRGAVNPRHGSFTALGHRLLTPLPATRHARAKRRFATLLSLAARSPRPRSPTRSCTACSCFAPTR